MNWRNNSNRIITVSGYFIWLHCGHIEYFRQAKRLGGIIIAIVNNDNQQLLKYKKIIVPLEERLEVVRSIKYIDRAIPSIDQDRTVCETLRRLKPEIFANGGDRHSDNVPEKDVCDEFNIRMISGLGKKIQSSSWLMKKL